MNKLILNFKSKDSKKIKNPKNFLGGKGANLSEMGRMGLPVPPGFTISTKVCEIFYKDKKRLNSKLINEVKKRGVSVILITHRLQDIFKVCDRVTVMFEGKDVADKSIQELDLNKLVSLIVQEH